MGPGHMENIAELACRTALAYRGIAHITVPVDFKSRSPRDVGGHVATQSVRLPSEDDLRKAADILNAVKRDFGRPRRVERSEGA